MALHVGFDTGGNLCLILGYEDGRVEMWRISESGDGPDGLTEPANEISPMPFWYRRTNSRLDPDGERRWQKVYDGKGHNEAGTSASLEALEKHQMDRYLWTAVMGMTVTSDLTRAFSVSADHLLCRHDLIAHSSSQKEAIKKMSTGQIGNASIAISADDRVLAVGGWDGK